MKILEARDAESDGNTSPLLAGVGQRDITTSVPSAGVRDPLYAKALVLDDGVQRMAVVTMDVVAIGGICEVPDDFLPQLRARVEIELKIPGGNVMVNAAHTHPPEPILCPPEELLRRTFDAIREASENLEPVRVGCGKTEEKRISMNRNLRLRNGRGWSIRHANPSPPNEEVEAVGPTDPEIGIVRLDRLDGKPLAILFHFACHLLFGDPKNQISTNFAGVACRMIEDCIGDGTRAFFIQGSCGDVIDVGFKDFNRVRDVEPFGLMLGAAVVRAAKKIETQPGRINVIHEQVLLPRRNDFAKRLECLKSEQEALLDSLRFTSLNFSSFLRLYLQKALNPQYPSADAHIYLQAEKIENVDLQAMDEFRDEHMKKYMSALHTLERLAVIQDDIATYQRHEQINQESGSSTIEAEFQGMRIGDFVLVTAPIEVLAEVAMGIKKSSPHPFTYVSGFTNGYMHYGPLADAYDCGVYEVIECFLAPEWHSLFNASAQRILEKI